MKNVKLKITGAIGILCIGVFISSTFSCKAANVEEEMADYAISEETPDYAVSEEVTNYTKPSLKGKYDFSDTSNWNLTISAWEKLAEKDYEGVFVYARKCLELYEEEAKKIALEMRKFAGPGHEDEYAVVNDVATCHYIMGETYMKQREFDKARQEFNIVIEKYPYAQSWDSKGWFWKVAEISKKNIDKIVKETSD